MAPKRLKQLPIWMSEWTKKCMDENKTNWLRYKSVCSVKHIRTNYSAAVILAVQKYCNFDEGVIYVGVEGKISDMLATVSVEKKKWIIKHFLWNIINNVLKIAE